MIFPQRKQDIEKLRIFHLQVRELLSTENSLHNNEKKVENFGGGLARRDDRGMGI